MRKWTCAPTYRVSLLRSLLTTRFALWYPCESHDGHEDVPTPALRRREEGEDIQSSALGSAADYPYPAPPNPVALRLGLLLSCWVQWEPREPGSSTPPTQLLVPEQRHRPQVTHTLYPNTAQHLHCTNTSQLWREESSAPRKSPCNDTVDDISVGVRHWHLTHAGSPRI